MRPLRYSINVTLDGCVDHRSIEPDEELHRRAAEILARADVLLFGRVIYGMMESAWRDGDPSNPFVAAIDPKPKVVVSDTLESVDWNAELVRGADLESTVRKLKEQPGEGIYTGGVALPLALTELGLIDEYELVVHPQIAGYGPTLFAGLSAPVDLELVDRVVYDSGAVAHHYVPRGR
ncbi:dihydrofolate reductase family protein [Actinomycetospora termitidis]|uniref:Dihydrofolate reductase family protein n=1 Tax=Actinomycetospora termitidis TaxID=3053470 RepID=A0ABT7M7X1_9PSEU|nr:dihydrofolate reductase family protein [Actinomycetospora sp. Odt1-22]MDL5156774.1 dihydrofolate reductase family protein [Actinomycetospora sp. Odt1-22]